MTVPAASWPNTGGKSDSWYPIAVMYVYVFDFDQNFSCWEFGVVTIAVGAQIGRYLCVLNIDPGKSHYLFFFNDKWDLSVTQIHDGESTSGRFVCK